METLQYSFIPAEVKRNCNRNFTRLYWISYVWSLLKKIERINRNSNTIQFTSLSIQTHPYKFHTFWYKWATCLSGEQFGSWKLPLLKEICQTERRYFHFDGSKWTFILFSRPSPSFSFSRRKLLNRKGGERQNWKNTASWCGQLNSVWRCHLICFQRKLIN